jgi:hypothetical protein
MRIQHFDAGFVNKQDIYRILVPMHELILQGKKGPNQNQKVGNFLKQSMLVDEGDQEEELQQTSDSEKVNTTCPKVSNEEKIPPWRLERKPNIQIFLP